jgi:hypothetical protein
MAAARPVEEPVSACQLGCNAHAHDRLRGLRCHWHAAPCAPLQPQAAPNGKQGPVAPPDVGQLPPQWEFEAFLAQERVKLDESVERWQDFCGACYS